MYPFAHRSGFRSFGKLKILKWLVVTCQFKSHLSSAILTCGTVNDTCYSCINIISPGQISLVAVNIHLACLVNLCSEHILLNHIHNGLSGACGDPAWTCVQFVIVFRRHCVSSATAISLILCSLAHILTLITSCSLNPHSFTSIYVSPLAVSRLAIVSIQGPSRRP